MVWDIGICCITLSGIKKYFKHQFGKHTDVEQLNNTIKYYKQLHRSKKVGNPPLFSSCFQ
jgi:hypothetical protein